MSKQEKIVCAAVRTNEHGTKIRLYVEYPDHIKKDKQIYGVFGECSHERGFITNTNTNRFVDPKEAMKIAVEAEQLEGFLNANYWGGFKGRINDPETSCKELADEYLKRELKPEDLY